MPTEVADAAEAHISAVEAPTSIEVDAPIQAEMPGNAEPPSSLAEEISFQAPRRGGRNVIVVLVNGYL